MNGQNQPTNLPRHVGLITDGNRRWAKERGLPNFEGHRKGCDAGKKAVEYAYERGIKEFTAWAFSTENWDRSKEEVDYLMKLFEHWIGEFLTTFKDKNVKIRIIGQKWRVPESLQKEIERVERQTRDKNGMTLNIALSYGGRDEIVEAIRKIVKNGTDPEEITEKLISENLWVSDVDLIIRTGGEQRLSGFLAWQATYAELFFIKKYLPDFTPADFEAILAEYALRRRRFGK